MCVYILELQYFSLLCFKNSVMCKIIKTCRYEDHMWVLISLALEFGITLNGFLRKEPLIQTLYITWILMLQRANMLINYLMTKYPLCGCRMDFLWTCLSFAILCICLYARGNNSKSIAKDKLNYGQKGRVVGGFAEMESMCYLSSFVMSQS